MLHAPCSMKVLFFNYEYPPLGGGAGNATFYILKEFAKIPNLEVDLVTSSHDSKFHIEKIGENITVHKLPVGNKANNLHFQSQKDLLIYSWKAYFYARRLIKVNSYNLTHSFFTVPCGFLSMVYYRLYNIPYIVSLRGADVPGYAERFTLIYKLLTPLIKKIWKNAYQVISNSGGLKNLALKASPKQEIGIIYNGINVEEFKPDLSKRNLEKFIVTPGASRITSRKGLKYLIEAVAILAKKYPQILLKIIGDGDERKKLEIQISELGIKDKVFFTGAVEHQNVYKYYQEASAFVLPSLNEGMSNSMLEALASGLPIIATDTGGSREIIQENTNGFIIKFNDSNDIAKKLEKLIVNAELIESMGTESRKIAENMSWEKVAQQYYELYKQII